MSEYDISPNMGMPVPNVSGAPGPNWATDINACFSVVDGHNHSAGSGVQITPSGLNISADLPFLGNSATGLGSVGFNAGALLSSLNSAYVNGVDLWFTDGAGNQIRITQSGSVTGASGTITGLPSGTASASYSAGTFTFNSATNTPANMAVGPLIIGRNAALSKTVTITPNAAQAADYGLTLPPALPSTSQAVIVDSSGNMSFGSSVTTPGSTPIGAAIATFPNLVGAYVTAATTVADANGFVLCVGQTIADATSPMNGAVIPNLNGSQFIMGSTTAGTTGGSNNIPNHAHNFSHTHEWQFYDSGTGSFYTKTANSTGSNNIDAADSFIATSTTASAGGTNRIYRHNLGADTNMYSSGVSANANTGTGPSAVTGNPNSVDNRPAFTSAVYIMRIK